MSQFAVTWDYRCPFARNVHEHLAVGLADGADWDVTFLPFSLSPDPRPRGRHPGLGRPAAGRRPPGPGLGVVVRDQYPDRFLDADVALFAARHDEGLDLRLPEVVRKVLDGVGLPGREAHRGRARPVTTASATRSARPTSGRSPSRKKSSACPRSSSASRRLRSADEPPTRRRRMARRRRVDGCSRSSTPCPSSTSSSTRPSAVVAGSPARGGPAARSQAEQLAQQARARARSSRPRPMMAATKS